MTSALFSPLTLGGVTLENRITISPMCQYSAREGRASDWHMLHLRSLALSGAGLLCLEATAVEAEGRISPGDLGLYDDATEAALVPVVAAIRAHAKIALGIQIAHARRKASTPAPWLGDGQLSVADGGRVTSAGTRETKRYPGAKPVRAVDRATADS